jgi:RNA polymerase-binding transcription factor DksA
VEERYESQLAQSARVLDDVDRALERLSAGTYDSCETCGAPILEADLAVDPTRRVCEQHLALDGSPLALASESESEDWPAS